MVILNIRMAAVEKPWGRTELGPWGGTVHGNAPVGELWFEPVGANAAPTSLLLKLLFTSQPLSIQVHPNDEVARRLGLPNGKTEAWVVLSAEADSKIVIGLQREITPTQLRGAIFDGSIVDVVQWRSVAKDDVVFVPAGTIHALGPGLVVLEVQQRSDTTFRLFDFGRGRTLDVEHAVNSAYAGPAGDSPVATRIDDLRTLLLSNRYFTLERLDLPPASGWQLLAENEAWVFALQGNAQCGDIGLTTGEAVLVQRDSVCLKTGAAGFKCLVAYAEPCARFDLLRDANAQHGLATAFAFSARPALHEAENPRVEHAGVAR